ncbi:MAG TPA: ABC transporter substrate-binding protein/permease [Polyangia bacterium]|nr:ABC transporter substrate-binding protein/permease [Polyangia bacterium]
MLCSAAQALAGSALERVRSSGDLRWGADEQGGEPYVYEDPARGGALTGFEVDLAESLAGTLGLGATFVQSDWSTLIPSLERGTFDIALNGIEVTPARAARVAFTRPYYLFAERLVARRGDARIRDLSSLRGLRVGTLASTQAWDLLRETGAVAVPYEGVDEPFVDLEHGRSDAVVLDDVIVGRYLERHPGLAVVGDVAQGSYAIAVRPQDDDLRRALDQALGQLIASGAWRRTLARWGLDGPRQAGLSVAAEAPAAPPVRAGSLPLTSQQIVLFLQGAGVTLVISLVAMLLAAPLGMALALLRTESRRFGGVAAAYIELVRGTPVLLQLYLLYYGLAGVVSLGPWTAAIVGLGLNYAAYEAEIYRGAIAAVPPGQWEAALAIGMTRRMALREIILPQAFRLALPGVTNDFISLLKDSSLVSVLTVVELTKRMTITAIDDRNWLLPGLLCAGLYFALGYPFTRLARRLETPQAQRPS